MSFLRRGNRRGRRSTALVVAGALFGFQALALIGATAASAAVVTCNFSGGNLTMTITGASTLELDGVNIIVDTFETDDLAGTSCDTQEGATVNNTNAILITGDAGDNVLTLLMNDGADLASWTDINWTIDLGADATDDTLAIDASGVTDANDDLEVTFGASGIDLNSDDDLDVAQSNIEIFLVTGGAGDDTISGAGSTAAGGLFTGAITGVGAGGDDLFASGAGADSWDGGADEDTIDASGGTSGVTVNLTANLLSGGGLGSDTLAAGTIEDIVGSGFNDLLDGDAGSNVITPGAGDDTVNGQGDFDYADYSDATAAVTVDLAANTATGGSGNDTLAGIEGAFGSSFDDVFIDQTNQDNEYFGDSGADTFSQGADPDVGDFDIVDGEGGIDTVDYGERTESLNVELDQSNADATDAVCVDASEFTSGDLGAGEADCLAGIENAILGTGDDTFTGNAFANRVWPNGGQNVLNGDAAAGPATGGDVLDYSVGYEAGVNVNMAGGATAGDSAIGFENAIGTAFNDKFVGDDQSNTIRGAGGNDGIRSGGGDDTARGGPGNDRIRTGSGDDDAFGGAGNDRINGGGGVDFCKGGPGNDRVRGCEQGRA
jgi:hypothetical protein